MAGGHRGDRGKDRAREGVVVEGQWTDFAAALEKRSKELNQRRA
jgi:hypothetical protein